ncbi:hypothetical protein D0469_10710 [Peribacillus saganii]|uniref:Bacterial Pleckstrin homology domain-containing protein n=1 Tax=Peribacillus saganii TaxID=2303992 RepID=A0A372LN50_9BACI|nr:PH domain-containing protein [Peribacillus saganii]RFU68950.1 hypothetical protein D0469_10710 [Peribacillus saganii]
MADVSVIMTWTFYEETQVPQEIQDILIEGDAAEIACKTVRDVAVVTNKRIINADRQGITGKKVGMLRRVNNEEINNELYCCFFSFALDCFGKS